MIADNKGVKEIYDYLSINSIHRLPSSPAEFAVIACTATHGILSFISSLSQNVNMDISNVGGSDRESQALREGKEQEEPEWNQPSDRSKADEGDPKLKAS